MSADEHDGPMRVDVGLKASLDVKAEIPKESTGRLLDALTDAIRPFTEARGLRADQIRLQRAEVALEIAKKAKKIADLENIELHAIPTKLLVPFLEKASLEDSDIELQDRWATLLLSASKEYHARHLTFVDILSRLSSDEVKLLEEICFSNPWPFPSIEDPGHHVEFNRILIFLNRLGLEAKRGNFESCKATFDAYSEATHRSIHYGGLLRATVIHKRSDTQIMYYAKDGVPESHRFRSLSLLQREQLINIKHMTFDSGADAEYFEVSFLGVSFVNDCCPGVRTRAVGTPPTEVIAQG